MQVVTIARTIPQRRSRPPLRLVFYVLALVVALYGLHERWLSKLLAAAQRRVWNVLSARHLPWKWVAIPPAAPNSCVVQLPAVVPAVSLEKTDDEAIPPTQKKTDQQPPFDEFIIEQPKTPAATDTNDEDFFTPESKPTTPVSSSDDEDHRSSDAMQMRATASDTAVGASIEESTFDYLNEIEISFSDDDIPSG